MTYELFTALLGFAFVSSITPGPNNLMLMASGANFGLLRTVPHMLGVALGFMLMIVLVGVGLVQLFDLFPVSHMILKVFSVVYLVYLAVKIATATPKAPDAPETGGVPMTFLQAAAFQWVNPKAWTMALTAITFYAPSQTLAAVGLVAVIFGLVNLPSVSSWTILGQQMRRFLTNTARLRAFNIIMALLLIATLYPILFPSGA
ncbi:LysE family translocator [Thalassobium sp. R2A62]|jgi:threonine/homoserine/homoserine lactone efflux protein|uniref:LysE family translocator n=1 Tax=Thalassobium sp. R2A62 TaxID=633131 RepID=UPI0001B1CFC2|nr:LysE family translocator [Thalassobium sp. R2A62]EET47057.1 lysine exporter protein [Thalassobium sp. R2A62]MDG1338928.1 LysE family translocator [Paracoccaceae bacterium]MDG2451800.1 LysE family translocator [Paracoccaceae bacterium]